MFSFDYLSDIWDSIENKIYLERLRYEVFYETIEKYVSSFTYKNDRTIMVGGTIGIDLLLEKERSIEDFQYELYSEMEFIHANDLTNLLEETNVINSSPFIISLKTTIPNLKYQIIIDSRIMVTIYKLPKNSYELILPVKVNTFDKKNKVLVISPEIQLLDIYRSLYSPNESEDWESILYDETKLFHHLKKRIQEQSNLLTVIAASPASNISADIMGGTEHIEKITTEERKRISLHLLKDFIIGNPNVVLIGEYACSIILGTEIGTTILQIISQNNLDDDFLQIERIIHTILNKDIPVVKLVRDLHIMQDFRLRRTTIKIGDQETGQKEILYIYNSANYDLIPFNSIHSEITEKKLNLGNPFVILRFLLIEFWIIRWIRQLGSIDEQYAKGRLDTILGILLKLRSVLAKEGEEVVKKRRRTININTEYFDSLLQPTLRIFPSDSKDYIGSYDDENISIKIIIKDLNRKYFDYYPYDYKKKNNFYRKVG